eukprot:scaffold8653_cov84-Isochrysis_galbana.AAC.1
MKDTKALMYVRHRRQRTTPADPKFTTGTGASAQRASGVMIAPSGSATLALVAGEFGRALTVMRTYLGWHCPGLEAASPRASHRIGSESSSPVGRTSSSGATCEPPGPPEMLSTRNLSAKGWSKSVAPTPGGEMYPGGTGRPGAAAGLPPGGAANMGTLGGAAL